MRKLKRCIAFLLAMLIIMTAQGMEACLVLSATVKQTEESATSVESAATTQNIQLTGICDYESAYEVLQYMNEEREKAGLNSLKMDQNLMDAAMLRAAELVIRYSDTRPDGKSCDTACEDILEENISAGQKTAKAAITYGMDNAKQRENILNSAYESVGIGCFDSNGERYWVQCFGSQMAIAIEQPENCEMVYTIPVDISNLTFSAQSEEMALEEGETKTIHINMNSSEMFQPLEMDNHNFSWSNSNAQAVRVVNGEITALASGTAKIVAKLGNKKVTVSVTVSAASTTSQSYVESTTQSTQTTVSSDTSSQTEDEEEANSKKSTNKKSTTEEPEIDMTKVTLGTCEVTGYMLSQYKSGISHTSADVSIKIKSAANLDEKEDKLSVTCKSSNKKVTASAKVKNNVLKINAYSSKKADTILKVKIDGRLFKIKLHLRNAYISNNSYLLVRNRTKQLKLNGCSSAVTWTSSDESIATVSDDGVVTGKSIGNVVITAQIGNQRVGCAVSVTTSQLKKVCARARYMGKNWTYSQARRTANGYYDCSSLVWKAYKMYGGTTFGSPSYPSVALSEAIWCKKNGCMVKGGFSTKNLKNMKVNPGDLLFKSSYSRRPYAAIYHVEMFTGYTCLGYRSDGTPILGTMWGARKVNYAQPQGQLLGRPGKA